MLPGCSDDADDEPAAPARISVPQAALHPEGIQWDEANQRFIVSSRTKGAISTVRDDSTFAQLADDARLIPNDIAVDAAGNAYVTDRNAPIIYKVDPQGVTSVFLTSAQFDAGTAFGLNGIVYHPEGYPLVAKANTGTLFKVPIANPAGFTAAAAAGLTLTGADGLLLTDPQTLLLVSGSQSTVYRLSSPDAWATCALRARLPRAPSAPPPSPSAAPMPMCCIRTTPLRRGLRL